MDSLLPLALTTKPPPTVTHTLVVVRTPTLYHPHYQSRLKSRMAFRILIRERSVDGATDRGTGDGEQTLNNPPCSSSIYNAILFSLRLPPPPDPAVHHQITIKRCPIAAV